MKITIDIPDYTYNRIRYLEPHGDSLLDILMRGVQEGTPIQKGNWIVGEYMDCHSDILPQYTCPFCGEVEYRKYDFCHCGADMREEEEE